MNTGYWSAIKLIDSAFSASIHTFIRLKIYSDIAFINFLLFLSKAKQTTSKAVTGWAGKILVLEYKLYAYNVWFNV